MWIRIGNVSGLGMKSNVVLNDKTANDRTLIHEIGHAKWRFLHPRNGNVIFNRPAVVGDNRNFMFWTPTDTSTRPGETINRVLGFDDTN